MITVLVGDQFPLVYGGMLQALSGETDIEVIGQARNAAELEEQVKKHLPDLVILGVLEGEASNLNILSALSAYKEKIKTVVLTTSLQSEEVAESMSKGASGFLGKNIELSEIPHILRDIAAGNSVISRYVSGKKHREKKLLHVSEREREILLLLKQGCSNREISEMLYISISTVNTHIRRLVDKLNLKNRNDLLLYIGSVDDGSDN